MSLFKTIKIKDLRKETADSVSLAFDVEGKNDFAYQSGQYITIKKIINGEEVRRSYSLSSAPHENDFRVVVKKVKDGRMSTFLNTSVKIGDELEVMTPSGNFVAKNHNANLVGIAAGSGITPIFSLLKSVLKAGGKFTLYYGNINPQSTIYKNEIDQLLAQHSHQLTVHYTYDEGSSLGFDEINSGRIDEKKMKAFIQQNMELLKADGFFICGPEPMINAVSETLNYVGISKDKIHFELFTVPVKKENNQDKIASDYSGTSSLTVLMDGEEIEFDLAADGDFILDASIEHGVDAPFSCKGAVCCTCKAKVLEGKATMEMNYSLSDEEVAQGYILTCQAHPASDKLVVDFDVT